MSIVSHVRCDGRQPKVLHDARTLPTTTPIHGVSSYVCRPRISRHYTVDARNNSVGQDQSVFSLLEHYFRFLPWFLPLYLRPPLTARRSSQRLGVALQSPAQRDAPIAALDLMSAMNPNSGE